MMLNSLHLMPAWFLFFQLTFATAVWSSTPSLAPTHTNSVGICKSRLEIFGYECEEHTITTEDGYILSLQRIPNGRRSSTPEQMKKIPVLLQHGVLMDGITWLLNSPENSLGYILADKGYDVWIINSRGTRLSRGHTMFSVNSSAYWDWSWDELVAYDLPATYEYVFRNSGSQKIHFIGHSLGTLMALASFSKMKLVELTRSATLLCPVAYMNQVTSPLARGIADAFLAESFYWLGVDEFTPTIENKPVQNLLKVLCLKPDIDCYDLLTSLTGKNCCLNHSSVEVFLDNEPQPTSTKNIMHMSQLYRRGTLTKFDYDDHDKNVKHYGQPNPPTYNLSAIPNEIPLFFSYGGKDGLSDDKDVKHLLAKLTLHKTRVQYQPYYAHADFVMGINTKQHVYGPLISFLQIH